MNARIDLAVIAGLAECPNEKPSNNTALSGELDGSREPLDWFLAPLAAMRLWPCSRRLKS